MGSVRVIMAISALSMDFVSGLTGKDVGVVLLNAVVVVFAVFSGFMLLALLLACVFPAGLDRIVQLRKAVGTIAALTSIKTSSDDSIGDDNQHTGNTAIRCEGIRMVARCCQMWWIGAWKLVWT